MSVASFAHGMVQNHARPKNRDCVSVSAFWLEIATTSDDPIEQVLFWADTLMSARTFAPRQYVST